MRNVFYLVTNAAPAIDRGAAFSKWGLSAQGRLQAQALAGRLPRADVAVSSLEERAVLTAHPYAQRYKVRVSQHKEFSELGRDASGFLEHEDYLVALRYSLKNPDKSRLGWEPASQALERFQGKVTELDLAYNRRTIIVFSHCIVINLYLSLLLGMLHAVCERVKNTGFCSIAIVRDNRVIQDNVHKTYKPTGT